MIPGSFSDFQKIFLNVLDRHAHYKTRVIRGNNKSHINKTLRKAIMKRSKLKNIANSSRCVEDYDRYKKQRNHVCNLKRKAIKLFFANVGSSGEGLKAFWHNCKPYFSSSSDSREEKFFLAENDRLISNDYKIAKIFNSFFVNITKSLNITK